MIGRGIEKEHFGKQGVGDHELYDEKRSPPYGIFLHNGGTSSKRSRVLKELEGLDNTRSDQDCNIMSYRVYFTISQ